MARRKLTLQDVAQAAADRNGGKGGRALQRLADAKGLTLSYATVDRILAGKYESTPKRQTIEALAVLAEMPLEDVYDAAGVPLPMASFAEQLPDGSDQLTVHQRRVVLDVIRGFIRDNKRIDDLENELELAPLHPDEILRQARAINVRALGDEELDWWYSKLALTDMGDERESRTIRGFLNEVEHEYEGRELSRTARLHSQSKDRSGSGRPISGASDNSVRLAGDAISDGLTPDDFDSAADHGTPLRDPMDTEARRRGEESQDPGTDEPA